MEHNHSEIKVFIALPGSDNQRVLGSSQATGRRMKALHKLKPLHTEDIKQN